MGLLDAFTQMDKECAFESAAESLRPEPVSAWDYPADDQKAWLDRYVHFTERPYFNPNIDGYISPYAYSHWGATSDIMQSLTDTIELMPMKERVDPNRVFTSSISSLRTTAADQIKAVRMFEKKFFESLAEKGKVGLTEDDIAAMQALTTARNTLIAITKEQIGVQKNIAELKIKQQQAGAAGGGSGSTGGGRPANAFDVGRSIMDNLFDVPAPQTAPTTTTVAYPAMNADQASSVLDSIITDASKISETVKFENAEPTTYLVIGDDKNDVEFRTYSANNELLEDYPNPQTKITSIDYDAKTATDELMVSYPIKYKSELGEE